MREPGLADVGLVGDVGVAVQHQPGSAPALLSHLPVRYRDPVSVLGCQPGQTQSVLGTDQTGLLVAVVDWRDDSAYTGGQSVNNSLPPLTFPNTVDRGCRSRK